jgi:hypothetical protein
MAALYALAGLNSTPTPEPAFVAEPDTRTGAELLRGHFTTDGFRARPAYPVEFAAVYGLAPGKPYMTLAAVEWSEPQAASAPGRAELAETKAEINKPETKKTLVAQRSRGATKVAAVLPPPRPAALATIVTAEAQPPAPAKLSPSLGDERVRLLGVRLPGFVPSGEKIARTVVSWGDSIVSAIPGI